MKKWKIWLPVLVVAVLAAAFWYGGSAPDSRGLPSAQPPQTEQSAPAPQEERLPAGTAEQAEKPPEQPQQPENEQPQQPENEPEQGGQSDAQQESAPAPAKDAFQTEPVPEGKPAPVEPQDATLTDTAYTCTISIRCDKLLEHLDMLDGEKAELVPEDGWILLPTEVTFYEGESVFNVLQRTCKQQSIHMEYENTPMYNSAYIEGIHNLYEFDCGELSGWMYKVNDWFPNYGCSRYQLSDGDVVCWVYTCDLGVDVGGYYGANGRG